MENKAESGNLTCGKSIVHDPYWFWKPNRLERKYALCRPEAELWSAWLFDEYLHRFFQLQLCLGSDLIHWHCFKGQVLFMGYHMKNHGMRTWKCACVLCRCLWCQSVLQIVAAYLLTQTSTFTEEESQLCFIVLWSWNLQLFPNLFVHITGHKFYPLLS